MTHFAGADADNRLWLIIILVSF